MAFASRTAPRRTTARSAPASTNTTECSATNSCDSRALFFLLFHVVVVVVVVSAGERVGWMGREVESKQKKNLSQSIRNKTGFFSRTLTFFEIILEVQLI